MSFEDAMGAVARWRAAVHALAALGAELDLAQSGTQAPPEVAEALRAVTVATGLGDLDDLAPQQKAVLLSFARLALRQGADLLEDPTRAPGWNYTDTAILDGWGRASMAVPMVISAAHADLAAVESFLDVGTGVGLLAVSAANVWPGSTIVGIDRWQPSLERARANVAEAGLGDRITLREQDIVDVDDVDVFDCIWVPTFFMDEASLATALPSLVRALRPGGWVALGRADPPPDPIASATNALMTLRDGGHDIEAKRAIDLLEQAGCVSVHAAPRVEGIPLELVLGQKPAA
jgi:SAM-dependent methyltransferase